MTFTLKKILVSLKLSKLGGNISTTDKTKSDKLYSNTIQFHNVEEIFAIIDRSIEANLCKGVVFIDSAFDFNLDRNQRPIALMQAFAKEGYIVCVIRFQWHKQDKSKEDFKCFYGKIFQIPKYDFLKSLDHQQLKFRKSKKLFIVNIPDQEKLSLIPLVKANGFTVVYDIMDHWEKFHEAGMVPWYKPEVEKFTVLNANLVTAVSPYLTKAFSVLRPVHLLTNGVWDGYDPNQGMYTEIEAEVCHVGYFGHLTEKWFNWEYIFQLANDKSMVIHIIGEGASPEILQKIRSIDNIHYYGYIPKTELRKYVACFQVGLIPFIDGVLSNSVDPLKVYEYLQYGIPVVSTGIPHLNSYPYCKDVQSFSEFKAAILEAKKQVLTKKLSGSEIAKFIAINNWDKKCHKLLELMEHQDNLSDFYE